MKAIVVNDFGGPEVLKIRSVADPIPQAGQVLIRVHLASVNFADIKARQGQYHLKNKPPFIPGLDLYGTIAALGPEVENLEIGQRVVAFPAAGSYAELAVADARLTIPIPETVDESTAGAFPLVGGAACGLLTLAARVRSGERVLVHSAAGGVGSTAVQICKALGTGTVLGTVGRAAKAEQVYRHGADHVLIRSAPDLEAQIKQALGGAGPDVILNALGGATLQRDLACLAPFGRLVSYGGSPDQPAQVDVSGLYGPNKAIVGFSFGTIRRARPELAGSLMQQIIELAASGQVRILVEQELPLESAAAAQTWIESGKSVGKTLLRIDS